MIKILVRARFAAMLAALTPKKKNQDPNKKPGKGMLVLMLVLYLYLGFIFMMLFFSAFFGISQIYLPSNMGWMYFSMFVILSFAMMFIGSVFTAKSQIFEAKDNDLLLAMPIRPRDILASRMLVLLLLNYLMEAVVAVPAAIVWMLFGNGQFLTWLGFLLTVLALPFFGLAISCLFAWVISMITAKLPKSSFVTVAAFLLFFFAYFYLISNAEQYLTLFAENGDAIASSLGGILPLYWFGAGIADGNLWQLAVSLLIYILPFALTYYLLSRSFIRLLTTKKGSRHKVAEKASVVRAGNAQKALLKRELARLCSSSAYMLNCGLSIPLLLIVAVAAVVKRDTILSVFSEIGWNGINNILCCCFVLALCFLNSMALFTAPSVSLEGKTLWLIRSLPVSSADILRAKLKMHIVITAPVNLICGIVLAIAYTPSIPVILLLLIAPPLYCVWIANIGLICNLCHPVTDWINEAQVVKQGAAILLTMLFSTLPVFVLAAIGVVLAIFSYWLTLLFVCALIMLGVVLTYRYLMRGGVARWEGISA